MIRFEFLKEYYWRITISTLQDIATKSYLFPKQYVVLETDIIHSHYITNLYNGLSKNEDKSSIRNTELQTPLQTAKQYEI